MIEIKQVSNVAELEAIIALQKQNLGKNLTPEEAQSQGFVTAEYTVEFLQEMHRYHPSIVAKDGDAVVGYALVAVKQVGATHELLADLFCTIDKIEYKGRILKNEKYVVVGQLCVAKNYRGMDLASRLYQGFKTHLEREFDYCLTDVARSNTRSLKAHIKAGFQVIDSLSYGGIDWDIVLWDWQK